MATIEFPSINVPEGCEGEAAKLLESMCSTAKFLSNPGIVSNSAMRTMTSSLEHSLSKGHEQALMLASRPKRARKSR